MHAFYAVNNWWMNDNLYTISKKPHPKSFGCMTHSLYNKLCISPAIAGHGVAERQWVSGSNGSTNVNGSRGSRVSAVKHLAHDYVRCKRVRG